MNEETDKSFNATVKSIGDVRKNNTNDKHNFYIRIKEKERGVYFFGDKKPLEVLKAKLQTGMSINILEFQETQNGYKAADIEVISTPTPQKEPEPDPNNPVARTIYCKWSNTNRRLTKKELEDYEQRYIKEQVELVRKITAHIKTAPLARMLFDKMSRPFQYYLEDQIKIEEEV